jgi:hypothetical protein
MALHRKEIFMQAANESDQEKRKRLVCEAELAIRRLRQQLRDSADPHEVLSTMAVAIQALRTIRVQ